MDLFLGVDPGWKNLGWCVSNGEGEPQLFGTMNPSEYELGTVPKLILDSLGSKAKNLKGLAMERYVFYDGRYNADSEHILLVTGQFQYMAASLGMETKMFRAIDWKTTLAKYLHKRNGWENPSDSFDKVFSIAAAKEVSGMEFKVDHVADAACLAALAGRYWKALKASSLGVTPGKTGRSQKRS